MQTTTVLLDAGGVILDESEHEAVRAEITAELVGGVVSGYSTDAYCADIEEAVRSFCPSVYLFVLWKRVRHDRARFDTLYGQYREEWRRRRPPLRLTAGFKSEVRELCGKCDIGIAGQYGRELLSLLEQEGILDCFTYRLTQDDFDITKPDPRYYQQIVDAFGVDAKQCIMVGDRIDKDIIPAKQLGMKTVLVRVGLHRHQQPRIPFEVPDAELDGVSGLTRTVLDLVADV